MSSAGIQKLFCGIYSTFKCSFDEFVGEKVFSPSYSSTILAPPLQKIFKSDFRNSLLNWSTQRRDRKREISRCLSLRFCLLLLSILLEIPNLHFPAIKGNKLTFQWKNKKNKLFNKPNLRLKPKIWCLFYFLTCFSLKKNMYLHLFLYCQCLLLAAALGI